MHDPAFERHPRGDAGVATGDNCSLAQGRMILGLRFDGGERHVAVDLALAYPDRASITAAKPDGRLDHRVEHWLQVEGRAADNLQHVAGRSLVFERLFQITGALAQFAE